MKLEEHNKEEFRYRSCFNKENCDPKTIDTSVLSVDYKSMPEKGTCIQGIHTERNYPEINCTSLPAPADPAAEGATENTVAEAANETASVNGTVADVNASGEGNSLMSRIKFWH